MAQGRLLWCAMGHTALRTSAGLQRGLVGDLLRIFFGMRRFDLAFIEIVMLWVLILATAIAFWRHDPRSAVVLLPYLAWVIYASALNYAIWRLNAGVT
jgi:tryptophan-rich sensory protein